MAQTDDRLTVVVGGSKGIGRHLADRAVQRGDRVIVGARSQDALLEMGRRHLDHPAGFGILADDFLAPTADFEPITSRLASRSGPVTLIISAAVIGPVGPLTRVTVADWADALARNVTGPARILAAALPHMKRTDLVVVFSGGGVGGPNPQPNVSAYTTSKAALLHLIEVTAREHPDGPALVAIAPGAFPTGFTDPVLDADPALAGPALLDDVRRTKQGAFDASDLDTLLDYLESNDVGWLSGRTISARRDGPEALALIADAAEGPSPDLYKLRRVDGVGITVQAW